jgi:hypothetical protein
MTSVVVRIQPLFVHRFLEAIVGTTTAPVQLTEVANKLSRLACSIWSTR